jgi:hypothetical protein
MMLRRGWIEGLLRRATQRSIALPLATVGLVACARPPPPRPPRATPFVTVAPRTASPDGERRTLSILQRRSLSSNGAIGIPECDSYLTNLLRCLQRRIPSSQLIVAQQAVDATREAWRRQRAEDRGALVEACRRATATARSTFSAIGCRW